jgi:hypothetical protein
VDSRGGFARATFFVGEDDAMRAVRQGLFSLLSRRLPGLPEALRPPTAHTTRT